MEIDELIAIIQDKLTYLIGFNRGISSTLRSAGQVDPLTLSGDFESFSKDLLLIQNSFNALIEKLDDPEPELIEEPSEDLKESEE